MTLEYDPNQWAETIAASVVPEPTATTVATEYVAPISSYSAPAATDSGSGSGISTGGAAASGPTAAQAREEARRRAIMAHMGIIGGDAAEAANWNWEGNTQVNPPPDRSIRALMAQAQAAPLPASTGTGMGLAAQADPWSSFTGYQTPHSLYMGGEYDRALANQANYAQYGDPMEAGTRVDGIDWNRMVSEGGYNPGIFGQQGGTAGDNVTYTGLVKPEVAYENQVFVDIAKQMGLTPEEASAIRDQALGVGNTTENTGYRELLPLQLLMNDPKYADRVTPEARAWLENVATPKLMEQAEQWENARQAQRKASGGWKQFALPASIIAAPLMAWGASALFPAAGAAGGALGAGVDAFGSAVPAGFAMAPASTASGLGALGSLGSMSAGDIWSAFSALSPQEKMMLGQFGKMGMQAVTGGKMDPLGFGLDMGIGMSGLGGALGGMLSPALGQLGGQLGSNFLMSLGKGALSGGDMGDVLKNAAMSAGIGAAGSGVASAFDGGMLDFNFGGGAPVPGYMSEMDLGGYNGGYVPADLPSDVNPVAPYSPAAEEDFSNLFSKESYMNQPGFNTATLDDLSAFTSPVQGMLGSLPQAAPEAPAQPQAQPPQQPSATGRLAGAVAQQALGALRGLMGGDAGEARAQGQAPRRQEGQSEQEYQGQVQEWAVNYLGLDAQTMAKAGLQPGTPEYMNYIMEQADQIIADLGVDPEFLNGASVEQMQEQFRNMSQQQMNQLYRALAVRGQLDQSVNAAEGIDPFTGMTEEFGGQVQGNREIAAAQRGMARRAAALGGLRGADARDFLTGMLGTDVDIYGMKQSRRERDELAAQAEEEQRIREEDRRKRGRRQQRRVTQADLDQIFGVGY